MSLKRTTFHQSLIVNSCAALVFVVIVSAIAAVAPATAQGIMPPHSKETNVTTASWFGGHGGWWGEQASLAERCEARVDHIVERMNEHAKDEVEFTASQQTAWDGLLQAIRTSGQEVQAFCAKLDAARTEDNAAAPERLALAEEGVAVGLKSIQIIRPAFDAFYATLDEEKREMLDNLANRRHGGWH